jgi:hypothetical protein
MYFPLRFEENNMKKKFAMRQRFIDQQPLVSAFSELFSKPGAKLAPMN